MDSATQERYEKIANMVIMEVPQVQIAAACNVSPGRISQILEEEAFKEVFAALQVEELQKHKDINDGWDFLENKAVGGLMEVLAYNKNPDLLLRVAAVANKAQRRGSKNNAPIDPQRLGARVVINIQPQFVQKLEAGMARVSSNLQSVPAKQLDMLAPGQVEKLLSQHEILGDIEFTQDLEQQ